jgi:hypothetical protein
MIYLGVKFVLHSVGDSTRQSLGKWSVKSIFNGDIPYSKLKNILIRIVTRVEIEDQFVVGWCLTVLLRRQHQSVYVELKDLSCINGGIWFKSTNEFSVCASDLRKRYFSLVFHALPGITDQLLFATISRFVAAACCGPGCIVGVSARTVRRGIEQYQCEC